MNLEDIFQEVVSDKENYEPPETKLEEVKKRFEENQLPNRGDIGSKLNQAYSSINEDRVEKIQSEEFSGEVGEISEKLYSDAGVEQLEKDIEILENTVPQSDFDELEKAVENEDEEKTRELLSEIIEACLLKGEPLEDIRRIIFQYPEEMKDEHKESPIEQLKQIRNRKMRNYIGLVELPHLKLHTDEETTIGEMILIPPDSRTYEEDYQHYFEDSSVDGEFDITRIVETENPSLEIEIMAHSSTEAKEKLKDKLSEFTDVCSYLNPGKNMEELPMPNVPLNQYVFPANMEGRLSGGGEKDPQVQAELTREEAEGLDLLQEARSQDNQLSKRFSRGLHLFRKSNNLDEPLDKTVFLLASLEALIIENDGKVGKDVIIDRAVSIAQIGGKREEQVRSSLDNLYDARNNVLHSGITQEQLERDLETARLFLGNLVIQPMERKLNKGEAATLKQFKSKMGETKKSRYEDQLEKLDKAGIELDYCSTFTGELLKDSGEKLADIEFRLEFIDEGKNEDIHRELTLLDAEEIQGYLRDEEYRIEAQISEERKLVLTNLMFRVVVGLDLEKDLPVETSYFNYEFSG